MKKIMPTKLAMIAVALAVLALSPVFAQVSVAGQTIRYSYLFTVDSETEVRSMTDSFYLGLGKETYFTFTRNGCYWSESNGIQRGRQTYTYQGEQNNMLVFYLNESTSTYKQYLYFSKDYKRLNFNLITSDSQNYKDSQYASLRQDYQREIENNRKFYVYEQYVPPTPQQQTGPAGPDRMW